MRSYRLGGKRLSTLWLLVILCFHKQATCAEFQFDHAVANQGQVNKLQQVSLAQSKILKEIALPIVPGYPGHCLGRYDEDDYGQESGDIARRTQIEPDITVVILKTPLPGPTQQYEHPLESLYAEIATVLSVPESQTLDTGLKPYTTVTLVVDGQSITIDPSHTCQSRSPIMSGSLQPRQVPLTSEEQQQSSLEEATADSSSSELASGSTGSQSSTASSSHSIVIATLDSRIIQPPGSAANEESMGPECDECAKDPVKTMWTLVIGELDEAMQHIGRIDNFLEQVGNHLYARHFFMDPKELSRFNGDPVAEIMHLLPSCRVSLHAPEEWLDALENYFHLQAKGLFIDVHARENPNRERYEFFEVKSAFITAGRATTIDWMEQQGVMLTIPDDAFLKGSVVQVTLVVIWGGDTTRYTSNCPDDYKLISGVFGVLSSEESRRPLILSLQHCAIIDHPSHLAYLHFYQLRTDAPFQEMERLHRDEDARNELITASIQSNQDFRVYAAYLHDNPHYVVGIWEALTRITSNFMESFSTHKTHKDTP